MQNMDFYTGRRTTNIPPELNFQDPEYFTRAANIHSNEQERNRKKTSRMLSFIIALCIICFTGGLMIGIKFASGSKKEIMDKQTITAVNNLGKTFSNLIQKQAEEKKESPASTTKLFPKSEYPYVIRVGKKLENEQAQEIANYLSQMGHTVIISQKSGKYNLYTGPYKKEIDARTTLNKISGYKKTEYFANANVIKR